MSRTATHRPILQPSKTYQPQYASPKHAEEMTTISQWTWRSWAYSGKIASIKTGKGKQARLLIPLTEIERVMNEGFRPALAATQ